MRRVRIMGLLGLVLAGCARADHQGAGTPAGGDEAGVRRANIAFYEARVGRDPFGARDRAVLAALYLARGREGGGPGDFRRAEASARESVRLRRRQNPDAARVLAATLMAGHRFAEARDVMLPLALEAPADAVTRATLGEIALELGRYAEADSLFGTLGVRRMEPAIGSRYARWLELNGRSGEARALLEALRARQAGAFRVPAGELAWLDLRIGELAARNGRPDLAARAFERGLSLVPADARLLLASGRLALRRGEPAEALRLGVESMSASYEPGALVLLAEAATLAGDEAQASEYAQAVAAAITSTPETVHRDGALLLLDRNEGTAALLAHIRAMHAARPGVYHHDLLAWALYKAGRAGEALPYADSALARGTRDASLAYHAGMIALAAGDSGLAAWRLRAAREIDPAFDPRLAPLLAGTLAALTPR